MVLNRFSSTNRPTPIHNKWIPTDFTASLSPVLASGYFDRPSVTIIPICVTLACPSEYNIRSNWLIPKSMRLPSCGCCSMFTALISRFLFVDCLKCTVSPISELTTITPTRTLSCPISLWVIKCSTNFFCSVNSPSEILSDPSNRNIISALPKHPETL